MKKLAILILIFHLSVKMHAQVVAVFQVPASGIMYKPQLWNMILTNTGTTPITLHIEVTLTPVNSATPVLSGVTRIFTLSAGTTLINYNSLLPVQYNIPASMYSTDPNPTGLLPIGQFEACYHFFKHVSDATQQISEQCQDITVGPLSPPQLVYPYDQTSIEETHPQFSWLPPLPMFLFTNLRYDLNLVEINTNQSPADAIEQNMPIYQGTNLSSNTLLYPLSATALEFDKQYAWRVVAKNNGSVIGTTDVWQFSLKQFGRLQNTTSEMPYVELRKDPETAYAIFIDEIKFSYENETSDSIWNVKVYDLTTNRDEIVLPLDSIRLQRGQNLVRYRAIENSFFIHKHIYQLEILNARNELWRMRFEYRKTEETNN